MDQLSLAALGAYWNPSAMGINVIVFLNLLGALMLGLLVGYERSYHGRAAGMRTYGLVCMASAALTVVSGYPEHWFGGHATGLGFIDPTRTIQGIVTGIGFLGAGIIMKDGLNISGLSTAASIWSASAIGVLVGLGFYAAAIMLACLSAGFMMWGGMFETFLPSRHAVAVTLQFREGATPHEDDVQALILEFGYKIIKGSVTISSHGRRPEWRFVAISSGKSGASLISLAKDIPNLDELENFQISHARN